MSLGSLHVWRFLLCIDILSFTFKHWVLTSAAVTSRLLTIVRTALTIVSYSSNVTASLVALTIVRKFTPRWSKTIQTNYSYTQAMFMCYGKFSNKKPIIMRQFFSHVRDELCKTKRQGKENKNKQHAKKLHIINVSKNKAWTLRFLASLLHFIFFNAEMPCKNRKKKKQRGIWTQINNKGCHVLI